MKSTVEVTFILDMEIEGTEEAIDMSKIKAHAIVTLFDEFGASIGEATFRKRGKVALVRYGKNDSFVIVEPNK